jgi:hypothetical protein
MRLRFTILDLLCLTALIAMLLAWRADHQAMLHRYDPVVEEIADPVTPEPVSFAARQKEWQSKIDDVSKIPIQDMVGTALESFRRVPMDCPLYITHKAPEDPWENGSLSFKIESAGILRLSVGGHQDSAFAVADNVLYFLQYDTGREGGTVIAHDFNSGKQLWKTELEAAGLCGHFSYRNRIYLWLTSDAVEIAGHETCGTYAEVLDRATGKQLAHQVFDRKTVFKREDYTQE